MVTNIKMHLEIMRELSKDLDVNIIFYKEDDESAGFYDGKNIYLNVILFYDSEDVLYSAFFHELTHCLQHKRGSFKEMFKRLTEGYKIRRDKLTKLEHDTDVEASEIMNTYFPELKFNFTY